MLLLTMNEWIGNGKRWPANEPLPTVRERHMTFATRLPFAQALERVLAYQTAYNNHYTLAVNFRLLAVSTIPDTSDDLLCDLQVEMVEDLHQSEADFDAP